MAGEQVRSGFGGRFMLFYFFLGAVLAAAITAFVVVALQPGHPKPPPWSSWKPAKGNAQKMTSEIANHVASKYALNKSGDQLVAIIPGAPEVTQYTNVSKVSTIAILPSANAQNFSRIIGTGGDVQEQFCGLGASCSIDRGSASAARERLLRREALEVALYTFKYVPSTKAVIAYMPPPPGQNPATLLFLERSNLSRELSKPITATLPLSKPPLPNESDPQESRIIDQLTLPVEYGFQYRTLGDGTDAMILTPST
jgi:hypothetical protein